VSESDVSDGVTAKKRKKPDVGQSLIDLMEARSTTASTDRDEDELFLLSLGPALKRIAPHQKMACKMALMKVINDYEFVGTQPAFSGEYGCAIGKK